MLRQRRLPWLVVIAILITGGYLMLQPRWILRRLNGHTPGVLYSVETDARLIALTIDDGPDPDSTPRILEALAHYDAQATFFLLADRLPGNEALAARLIAAGHELGNHMITDQPSIRLTPVEFEQRLLDARKSLAAFAETRWFRPGSGWYNLDMLSILAQHGYRTVLGSIYPYDAHLPWPWLASRYILWRAHPGGIIILHDGGTRGVRTVETLRMILPELQARGYRLVTLSELARHETPAASH